MFFSDYEAIDELDQYEQAGIDDDEENDVELTTEARQRAEREIKRREREKRRRLGQELNDETDSDDDDQPIGLTGKSKRSRGNDDDIGMDDDVMTQTVCASLLTKLTFHFSPKLTSRILATLKVTKSPIGFKCRVHETK